MYDFVAFNSRWRGAWLFLFPLAFVATGLWMLGLYGQAPDYNPYSKWNVPFIAGCSVAGLLGLISIFAVWKFLDTREQLRISPLGIKSIPWSDRMMPWSEVRDVTVGEVKRRKWIVLHLHHPERYPAQERGLFKRARRKPTIGDIAISTSGIDCTFAEAMTAIERFRR